MVIKFTKTKLGGIFNRNQKWNILQKIDVVKMGKKITVQKARSCTCVIRDNVSW